MPEPLSSKNATASAEDNSNASCSTSKDTEDATFENDCESHTDLGFYINKSNLSDEIKYKLLTKPYVPSDNCDFKINI